MSLREHVDLSSIIKHAVTVLLTTGIVGGVGYTQQVVPVRGALDEVAVNAAQIDMAFTACQKRLDTFILLWKKCMEDCAGEPARSHEEIVVWQKQEKHRPLPRGPSETQYEPF